jgi:hypothetical protein
MTLRVSKQGRKLLPVVSKAEAVTVGGGGARRGATAGKAAENKAASSPSAAKKKGTPVGKGKGKAGGRDGAVVGGGMFKRVIATLRKHAAK